MFDFSAEAGGSARGHDGAAAPQQRYSGAYEREVDCFLAVIRYGGFTQAAASLGISKGLLKKRLQALESRMGEPLFQLTGNMVSLTGAGETCYRYISEPTTPEAARAGGRPPLRLAMSAMLMETVFCRPLMSWLRSHPGSRMLMLEEDVGVPADIVLWAGRGNDPLPSAQLSQCEYLATVHLLPCVARRSLLRQPPLASTEQLADFRLVQYEGYERWPGLNPWNTLVMERRHGVTTVRSPEMYWRLLKWLGYVGVVPEWRCRHDETLEPLPMLFSEPLTVDLWLGCRPEAMLGSDGRQLYRMIEQVARENFRAPT